MKAVNKTSSFLPSRRLFRKQLRLVLDQGPDLDHLIRGSPALFPQRLLHVGQAGGSYLRLDRRQQRSLTPLSMIWSTRERPVRQRSEEVAPAVTQEVVHASTCRSWGDVSDRRRGLPGTEQQLLLLSRDPASKVGDAELV